MGWLMAMGWLFRQASCHLVTPGGQNIGCQLMRLLGADVLGDGLRGGQPGGCGDFPDVVVRLCAEEGAQLHDEEILAAVMAGCRLGADFIRHPVQLDDANDLGGVEQGVDHAGQVQEQSLDVDAQFALNFGEGLRTSFPL